MELQYQTEIMKKSRRRRGFDRATLTVAIVGAVTGVGALAWQIMDTYASRQETLEVQVLPVSFFTDGDDVALHATVVNASRVDVYVSSVWLQIDSELPPGELNAANRVHPMDIYFFGSTIPWTESIRPRESRVFMLRGNEIAGFDPGIEQRLRSFPLRVVVVTTMGKTFFATGFEDQLIRALAHRDDIRRARGQDLRSEKVSDQLQ